MKKQLRLLAWILSLTMLCELLPFSAFAQSDVAQNLVAKSSKTLTQENSVVSFAGGDGSKSNPYQIATAEQLDAVRNDLDACYVLIDDVDLSVYSNWEPIGTKDAPFIGNFNGNSHTISNISIVSSPSNYFGLFGYVERSDYSISYINIENISIIALPESSSYTYYGSIAGYSRSPVSNCTASGSIEILDTSVYSEIHAGGIVGCGSTVTNSVNHTSVNIHIGAGIHLGGIAGVLTKKITDCDNYGNITGIGESSYSHLGGIVGQSDSQSTEITHCRNYGSISGEIFKDQFYELGQHHGYRCNVGGISGFSGSVYDSVNYGDVSSTSDDHACAGGIIGGVSDWYRGYTYTCYNLASSIFSSTELYTYAYRIKGIASGSQSGVSECYSLDTTLVNGEIPTTSIGLNSLNGESLSEAEINAKVAELFPDDYDPNPEPTKKEFEFKKDNFKFLNSSIDFFTGWEMTETALSRVSILSKNHVDLMYYKLSEKKTNQLLDGFSPRVKSKIYKQILSHWGGSCEGMSRIVALHYIAPDRLPLNEISSTAQNVYDLRSPNSDSSVEDFVNYYYMMQFFPTTYLYFADCSTNYNTAFEQTIDDIILNLNAHNPIFTSIQGSGGHAIVMLDVASENSDSYEINIYDPNYTSKQKLTLYKTPYVDSSGLKWPKIDYEYENGEHSYNRIQYHILSSDLEFIDLRNYFSKDNFESKHDYDSSRVTFDESLNVTVSLGNVYIRSENGKLTEISSGVQVYYPSNGDGSATEFIFPADSTSKILEANIQATKDSNPDIDIMLKDTYLSISTDGPAKLTYDEQTRTIDVTADDPTTVNLLFTQNDTTENWPWHSWAIDTTGTTTLHAELTDEGLKLSGDGLNNAAFATENADTEDTQTSTISAKADSNTGIASVTIKNNQDSEGNNTLEVTQPSNTTKPTAHTISITNGTVSVTSAASGEIVTITAADKSAEKKVFTGWTVNSGNITLDDSSASTTSFAMGSENVSITANYKTVSTTPSEPTKPTEPDKPETPSSDDDGSGALILLGVGAAAVAAATAGVVYMMPVKIQGKVESSDHAAIPNAKVSILKNGNVVAQTTADENGNFEFKVKRGTYELTAAYTDASGQLLHQTIQQKAPAENIVITF